MFQKILLLILLAPGLNAQPVPVILDTDIAGDYDDVGAMAMLHALSDKGETNILAVISCNAFETTVPTISVLNTYFGRADIPVGITERKKPYMDCPQRWAQHIISLFPHSNAAQPAIPLYRRILASQPDHSVTIIAVGFLTNLADLLASGPDQYSKLSGKELVRRKVKRLVSMAASLPEGKRSGREYNVYVDAKAAQEVFAQWETPVVLSPFEVGEKIVTGIPLIKDSSIRNSPVKAAYDFALEKDKNTKGRMSWDQTAVLAAIRDASPWFDTRKQNLRIEEDGTNTLIPGNRFVMLELKKEKAQELQVLIEELMHHQPEQ